MELRVESGNSVHAGKAASPPLISFDNSADLVASAGGEPLVLAAEPLAIADLVDRRAGSRSWTLELRYFLSDCAARTFDVVFSVALLTVLAPVMITCVIAVAASGPGPIIFKHVRIGRHGRTFRCLKFRTMLPGADAMIARVIASSNDASRQWLETQKLRSDPRVTKVGGLLRRFSLDELPQLFNVLAGEMSLVGPRPIVSDEIVRYGRHFQDYCSVRPGISGLWQVSGRSDVTYDERVRLDAEYVHARSTSLYLIILCQTVRAVFAGRGC